MGFSKNDLVFVGAGFLGGAAVGYILTKYFPSLIPDLPTNLFSFATVDCAGLCAAKNCTDYNCKCTNGCDACGGAAATGNCGSGPVSGSSGRWFQAKGSAATLIRKRCNKTKCGVDTGSGSGGNRWEVVKSGWMDSGGFEVVIYFTQKKDSACYNKDPHIGLKHGGPEHSKPCDYTEGNGTCSDSKCCCCWWDSGIKVGEAYLEIERSHANNQPRMKFGNVGKLDKGYPIGVRWLIKKESKGIRLMMWTDMTSKKVNGYEWKPVYNVLDTGQVMGSSYFSKITKNQNVEIRMSDINCSDVTVHNAETRKM